MSWTRSAEPDNIETYEDWPKWLYLRSRSNQIMENGKQLVNCICEVSHLQWMRNKCWMVFFYEPENTVFAVLDLNWKKSIRDWFYSIDSTIMKFKGAHVRVVVLNLFSLMAPLNNFLEISSTPLRKTKLKLSWSQERVAREGPYHTMPCFFYDLTPPCPSLYLKW